MEWALDLSSFGLKFESTCQGRDTMIPEINPSCHHQTRITVTGGHVLVTDYQVITRIGYMTRKV
jgi:hypothetical protein